MTLPLFSLQVRAGILKHGKLGVTYEAVLNDPGELPDAQALVGSDVRVAWNDGSGEEYVKKVTDIDTRIDDPRLPGVYAGFRVDLTLEKPKVPDSQ